MAYPIFLKVKARRCVVIGGGAVAARRVKQLLAQDAHVVVIAPDVVPAISDLAVRGRVEWRKDEYASECIAGAFLVIAATDQDIVNEAVSFDADARGVLVSCVSEHEKGNFTTPASIERGDLTLAITTGGASPTLTAVLKSQLEAAYGPEWDGWTKIFGTLRHAIQALPTEQLRRDAALRILSDPTVNKFIHGVNYDAAAQEARRCISL